MQKQQAEKKQSEGFIETHKLLIVKISRKNV